jgi:hypothetical protein
MTEFQYEITQKASGTIGISVEKGGSISIALEDFNGTVLVQCAQRSFVQETSKKTDTVAKEKSQQELAPANTKAAENKKVAEKKESNQAAAPIAPSPPAKPTTRVTRKSTARATPSKSSSQPNYVATIRATSTPVKKMFPVMVKTDNVDYEYDLDDEFQETQTQQD